MQNASLGQIFTHGFMLIICTNVFTTIYKKLNISKESYCVSIIDFKILRAKMSCLSRKNIKSLHIFTMTNFSGPNFVVLSSIKYSWLKNLKRMNKWYLKH